MYEIHSEHYRIAKQNGIARKNVRQRFWDYGWEIERAITEPVQRRDSSVWYQWKETCLQNGICNSLYSNRIRKGMTPEEAATRPVEKRGSYRARISNGRGGVL